MLNEQVIQSVGLDVCVAMLGLPVVPSQVTRTHGPQFEASVEIRGRSRTVVKVVADEIVTASIAEVMFAADRSTLSRDDMRDSLGEIANMIGGNLKGILGDEAELSLPSVVEREEEATPNDPRDVRVEFKCCDHPLTLIVHQMLHPGEVCV